MLNINKEDVDFLVTSNMVDEVKRVMDINFKEIDEIIPQLIKSKIDRVYFVACGSPLCACQTAKTLFDKYSSISCEAYSGWDFLDNTPAKLDCNTLVIGVSHSGTTEEVSNSIKLSKEAGAKTIGVTKDNSGTSLADFSEHVLAYDGHCIWEIHLMITYYIACSYINAVKNNTEITKILEDMNKIPCILKELVVSAEKKSKELGISASKWPFIYTVSAGSLLPLAYKEGIITMLEFTWTHGSMLNAAEFRHGPLEVVNPGVPYVFMLGTDESRHTTERTINFVKKFTEDYIVFDATDYSKGLHPMLDPMVLFVPLEYFYYYMAIAKDHNPDHRRYYGGLVEY